MAKEFRLQDPGEGIHEVEIQEILVSEGAQSVFVVESDGHRGPITLCG